MSAQLSEQFHVKLAKEFVESLTTEEKDSVYLFIGRGTPWPNGGDFDSTKIPAPTTSVQSGTYDYWQDMFALVRIYANNTSHVVPRQNWTTNARYAMYDHRIPRAELFRGDTKGTISRIVVNQSGSGYVSAPTVTITGDGSGATAQAVVKNGAISQVYLTSYGQNYTYATVTFTGGSPTTTGTATAIVAPNPTYVINDGTLRQVFKCVYNGRSNSSGQASQSTIKPDISLAEDTTQLLTTPGNPKEYIWKYLYTINSTDNFLTTDYMPVRATHDTLDKTTGDVENDNSEQYKVFNSARLTNNGAIYTVVVEQQGAGYTQAPTITITGDGTGAKAIAVIEDGAVSRIYMTAYGQNYSYATVSISGGGSPSSSATATAIISPRHAFANVTLGTGSTSNVTKTYYRTNHAIDLEQELNAKRVMIYKQLTSDILNALPIASSSAEYRRVGLIRNPLLAGTTNVASAEAYTTLTRLAVNNGNISGYTPGEIIYQSSTGAYGVFVGSASGQLWLSNVRGKFEVGQIDGIGNGNADGYTTVTGTIPATPEAFTPVIAASQNKTTVTQVILPDIQPYSGDILFVNHDTPTTRSGQTQTVRIVLTF